MRLFEVTLATDRVSATLLKTMKEITDFWSLNGV